LVDAFRHLHPDLVGNTFPSWDPHVRLDYLFVPGGFIGNVNACDVLARIEPKDASDHLPLCAAIDV
jgi:endonuclease/exonuclease/phosphatase family metal-dependent hydrolase